MDTTEGSMGTGQDSTWIALQTVTRTRLAYRGVRFTVVASGMASALTRSPRMLCCL